jgi:hypothetical protein
MLARLRYVRRQSISVKNRFSEKSFFCLRKDVSRPKWFFRSFQTHVKFIVIGKQRASTDFFTCVMSAKNFTRPFISRGNWHSSLRNSPQVTHQSSCATISLLRFSTHRALQGRDLKVSTISGAHFVLFDLN